MPRIKCVSITAMTILVLTTRVFAEDAAAHIARAAQRLGYNDFDTDHNECLKAISECDQAIAIDPKAAAAYCTRGRAQLILHEHDRALDDCNKAIDLDPKLAEAYLVRGHVRIFTSEYDKVIDDCNKAISLNAKLAEAYCHRGAAWMEKGEYDKARADFERTLALDPKLAEGYLERGLLTAHSGKYENSIVDFKRAVELAPKDWRVINNIGVTLWSQAQQQEATAATEDARGDQETAKARRQLVATLKKQAIGYWRHGLEVRPTASDIHSNLGYAYSEAAADATAPTDVDRNLDLSEKYLRTAVRLEEDKARPHNNLGRVLLRRSHICEAIAKQIEADRKSDAKVEVDDEFTKGRAKRLLANAVSEFERAIELDPKLLEARLNMAQVCEQRKEFDRAKEQYRAVLELQADKTLDSDAYVSFSNAQYGLARVAAASKQSAEAIRNLQQALKLNPRNLGALKMLVVQQYEAGEYAQGLSSLKTLLAFVPPASRQSAADELTRRLRDAGKDDATKRFENDLNR